jgi:DNA invertase Pin-like site-specific DNA recombinase
MSENTKLQPTHLQRTAIVYVRQSSPAQVEHNRESTQRQYALVERALTLGWQRDQISVIDEDLGMSGASSAQRLGFARLTTEVALKHVGIVLGLEVSRLARNNADWYRLLDLCGMTDTLIGDADGIYHPALFNDRLVLGLKGTMSEAELHILRARLEGGIRNKAARGELRRGLPVGFVYGEQDGEVRLHPDASVVGAIRTVFERFVELGSARQVWLWFRTQGLSFPLQCNGLSEIRWVAPTYTAIHKVLRHPVYAGAYVYGRSRVERFVNDHGGIGKRLRRVPRAQAKRAERRYRIVEPENRLVARGLEAEWEKRLRELQQAQSELAIREQQRPRALDGAQLERIRALGVDLKRVWSAPATEDRDRKELLRTLLEEVIIAVKREEQCAHLTLRWRSGALTELELELPRRQAAVRTDEDTIELIRRLAAHYPDTTIAGILNQQGRKSAYGERFTAVIVSSLRYTRAIPRYQPPTEPPKGELLSVKQTAQRLNLAASTVHRWLAEGFIAGEQLTPGAPWMIRMSEELRARFVDQTPAGYLPMIQATKCLGVSRQTVLQRVKRGELEAVHVCRGRRKGLRIKVVSGEPDLLS